MSSRKSEIQKKVARTRVIADTQRLEEVLCGSKKVPVDEG
jgi:hypothetical protein